MRSADMGVDEVREDVITSSPSVGLPTLVAGFQSMKYFVKRAASARISRGIRATLDRYDCFAWARGR